MRRPLDNFSFLLSFLSIALASSGSGEDLGVTFGGTHDAILLEDKSIVFFAGPDHSSEEGIVRFFHKFVSNGMHKGHPEKNALRYWRWPIPEGANHFDDQFAKLVLNQEAEDVDDILWNIKQKFWESKNGVIVGTEMFDQVGSTAQYDGMYAMQRILDDLDVPPSNVTVILNYRTPRLEQWISMWQHNNASQLYRDFMCKSYDDKDLRTERLSMIGASMNALNAAYEFLQKGWKVKFIDLEGVHKFNKDVTHVIGCDILLGHCDNGFLYKHTQDRTPEEDLPDILEELGQVESNKVEKLFRYRDCGYKKILKPFIESNQFDIMYKDTLWDDCVEDKEVLYEELADMENIVYDALLSQLNCENINDARLVSIDEALGIDSSITKDEIKKEEAIKDLLSSIIVASTVVFFVLLMFGLLRRKKEREDRFEMAVRRAEMSAERKRTSLTFDQDAFDPAANLVSPKEESRKTMLSAKYWD